MEYTDALLSGDFAKVQSMIEQNPELINQKINNETPFEICLAKGFTNIVKLLV